MALITMQVPVANQVAALLPGFEMVIPDPYPVEAVGRLYFESYEPGVAWDTLEGAVADIRAARDGDYGEFWAEASPLVCTGLGPVAAVQVVRRAPWPDTPDCPFIIEMFTDPKYRRRGLARALMLFSISAAADIGEEYVALRVAERNQPAIQLYESLGFQIT